MSTKSDMYSLGVIIIELVTGSKEEPNITNVLRRWKHRWNKSAKHSLLQYQQVVQCIELAQSCMDKDPLQRPFVGDIISAFNKTEDTNSSVSNVDQIISSLGDMIGIEPLELCFPFPFNKQISLQLTNDTDDYFAFRIQAKNPLLYNIMPERDVVPPRSKFTVNITIVQIPRGQRCAEELSIQSIRILNKNTVARITKDVFSEKNSIAVDTVSLTAVFDIVPLPEGSMEELAAVPQVFLGEDSSKYQGAVKASSEPWLRGSIVPGCSSQQVGMELVKDWKLVDHCGITPQMLPDLVEHNPIIAVEFLSKQINSPDMNVYFDVLVHMEMSLHTLDVVNRLTLVAIDALMNNQFCSDKSMQNRLLRQVCLLLGSIIQNKIINVHDLFVAVQAFCITFSQIGETAELLTLLKSLGLVDTPCVNVAAGLSEAIDNR